MIKNKKKILEMFEELLDTALDGAFQESLLNEPKTNKVDEILTFKEVCAYFHVSPTTLERRIREGLKYSQAVRKGNRLFKLSDCKYFFKLN